MMDGEKEITIREMARVAYLLQSRFEVKLRKISIVDELCDTAKSLQKHFGL